MCWQHRKIASNVLPHNSIALFPLNRLLELLCVCVCVSRACVSSLCVFRLFAAIFSPSREREQKREVVKFNEAQKWPCVNVNLHSSLFTSFSAYIVCSYINKHMQFRVCALKCASLDLRNSIHFENDVALFHLSVCPISQCTDIGALFPFANGVNQCCNLNRLYKYVQLYTERHE